MKRRSFLGLVAAAPVVAAAAALPVIPAPVIRRTYEVPLLPGFGMAPVKAEGAIAAFDAGGSNVMLTAAQFRQELLEGLNKVFDEAYAQQDPEWAQLFDESQDEELPTLYGFGS